MTWTLTLETILGWFYLIIGFSLLLQRQFWVELVEAVKKSVICGYSAASIAILLGLLIVLTHNIWLWRPIVFVTLFGWIMLLKGVIFFLAPPFFIRLMPDPNQLRRIIPLEAILLIAISVSILYEVYWM